MKPCTKCKELKRLDDFYKKSSAKDGLTHACKTCTNAKNNEWAIKNPLKRSAILTKYRNNNPEKIKTSYLLHVKNNEQAYKEGKRNWLKNNKQLINSKRKKRRDEDVCYKLSINLRIRLLRAIKKEYKSGSAVRDLGCSIQDFKKHLESNFQPGMTWENHGKGHDKWHIDHIKPLASFDLSDREQFKKACHYSNMQPLWAIDNLKKGSK